MSTTYAQMVSELKKPGLDILCSLNATNCDLWHMATGLSSEIGELYENVYHAKGRENLVEELGDMEFYLEGIFQSIGGKRQPHNPTPEWCTQTSALPELVIAVSDLMDSVKKMIVYNDGRVSEVDIWVKAAEVRKRMDQLYVCLDMDYHEAVEKNMEKLKTGNKARYKDGYSDEAARSRADKN